MELRFTQAARKHRIGRAHVAYVIDHYTSSPIVTKKGEPGLYWCGLDSTGRELEIVVVPTDTFGLVIHVMPTALKRRH